MVFERILKLFCHLLNLNLVQEVMALVYSETVVHSSIFFSGYRTKRNYLDWKIFFQ